MCIRDRPTRAASSAPAPTAAASPKRKLSYKDQRELDELPARIETLETKIADMTDAMNDPAFFQRDHAAVAAHNAELAATQTALEQAYARWEALDG